MYRSQVTLKDEDGNDYTLDADRVLTDDVTLQGEWQVGRSSLWMIGYQFGPTCAVWASNEQEALDAAVDADFLDSSIIEEGELSEYCEDEYIRAGNAGEPIHSAYLWMKSAPMSDQSRVVICWFAECRGAAVDTLGEL